MQPSTTRRKDVRLCIDSSSGLKGLLWLSFLPDGGVSAGFFDKTFIVPALDSGDSILNLEEMHGHHSITNPHFTLHGGDSPSHFHLKSQNGTVLCEALVWSAPLPEEEVSPWIRFISNPITALPPFERPAHGRTVELHKLKAPREDCSVAVHVDFAVSASSNSKPEPFHRYFPWHKVNLRVLAYCVPAQEATLAYEILG